MTRWILLGAVLAALAGPAAAHEVRPAYLELRHAGGDAYDVLWKVPARGETLRLALHVGFPPGCANVTEPRGEFGGDAHTERWRVRCPGGLAGGTIRIAGLEATLTDVLLRVQHAAGAAETHLLRPAAPAAAVAGAPGAARVVRTYLLLGVEHILRGVDHLLFVLALLLLVAGWRRLAATITAFTVAHSLTLAAAALGVVRVPQAPVEAVIALSIAVVAAELVRGRRGPPSLAARRPWVVAFGFGLLHGLGFAGALSEIGLPQQAIPLALLSFNLGVETGQLLFVAAALAAGAGERRLAARLLARPPAWAWRLAPYGIGTAAGFWVVQRVAAW